MPKPPPRRSRSEGASLPLARVAPLISRWVERLLGEHRPSLTLAQYLALEELDAGRESAGELARGAGVSRSASSQLVATLQQANLVEAGRASGDRRRRALVLTSEGSRALRSARRRLARGLDPLLAELPPHEADVAARSFASLEARLRGTPPPPRPPHPKPPAPRR